MNFIIVEIDSIKYGTFVIYCSEGEPVGVTTWCRHSHNGPGSYTQIQTTAQ